MCDRFIGLTKKKGKGCQCSSKNRMNGRREWEKLLLRLRPLKALPCNKQCLFICSNYVFKHLLWIATSVFSHAWNFDLYNNQIWYQKPIYEWEIVKISIILSSIFLQTSIKLWNSWNFTWIKLKSWLMLWLNRF